MNTVRVLSYGMCFLISIVHTGCAVKRHRWSPTIVVTSRLFTGGCYKTAVTVAKHKRFKFILNVLIFYQFKFLCVPMSKVVTTQQTASCLPPVLRTRTLCSTKVATSWSLTPYIRMQVLCWHAFFNVANGNFVPSRSMALYRRTLFPTQRTPLDRLRQTRVSSTISLRLTSSRHIPLCLLPLVADKWQRDVHGVTLTRDTTHGGSWNTAVTYQQPHSHTIKAISWPATTWKPAIVGLMVRVVRPSVCLSHANISEIKSFPVSKVKSKKR